MISLFDNHEQNKPIQLKALIILARIETVLGNIENDIWQHNLKNNVSITICNICSHHNLLVVSKATNVCIQ